MMNRRGFLNRFIGGVAAASAVRTWPFRVYSFPAEIIAVNPLPFYYQAALMNIDLRYGYGRFVVENVDIPNSEITIHPYQIEIDSGTAILV
jgi:hypothetical protein